MTKDKREDIINEYYKNADCIIMGYDITNKQSFQEIKSFWYKELNKRAKTNLIYLLGNKIDLKDNIEVNESEVNEFIEMNKIKYFSISVKDDINIQNLIDDIQINIENIDNNINNRINEIICENPSKESYKVIFIGDSGVGAKTSLLKVLVKGEFNPNEESTMGGGYYNKEIVLGNGKKIILNLWDTVGQEKYRSLANFFCQKSDCVVLGYDITIKESYESIKSYWYPTSKEISGANLYYLIGNKADLYDQVAVSEFEAREYAKNNNMRFFLISCSKKIGIKEFLDDLIDQLIQN